MATAAKDNSKGAYFLFKTETHLSERSVPGPEEWEPWSPEETAKRLAGCAVDWAVAGGWALDLHRGAQSRPHKDIEIVVGEQALPALRLHLCDYSFFAAAGGRLTEVSDGLPLTGSARQHWVLDPAASKWRLDIMTEPGDPQRWVYRRDPRITAARRDAVAKSDGQIPYLRPHIVLLFKAHHPRSVDQWDFEASLEFLDDAARRWLRDALQVTSPRHHWIERLS